MVTAVIPAYNEAERIGATVSALKRVTEIDEVLVIDDGSSDDTARLADGAGANVLCLEQNQGKGAALNMGIKAASGDIVLMIDADLGDTAVQAGRLITPILAHQADMSIATFPVQPGKGGGFGFVVKLARWGIFRATGKVMQAPLSGQRAIRREVIENIGGFAPGFGAEVALTIDALTAGYTVVEVPTDMSHRVTGRNLSGVMHRGRQFIAVARALWRRRGIHQ